MKFTHGGFANDVYHTYETFKVEVGPIKKKKEIVEEPEPLPETPKTIERKKQYSVKVGKTKELQRKVAQILNDDHKGTMPKSKKRPKRTLPT